MRKTITFRVPVFIDGSGRPTTRDTGERRWLLEDGGLGDEASAANFTLHASPTGKELTQIEREQHDGVGGLDNWLDLTDAMERARRARLAEVTAELWPNGEPELDAAAREELVDDAWTRGDSRFKRAWTTLTTQFDRVTFIAHWKVLAAVVPDGWRDLGGREWPEPSVFMSVWTAWLSASAEARAGK